MNRTSGGDLAKEHPCGEIENMGYVSIDQPLDLKLSLTMGQAFRWQSKNDGWYSGVLRGKLFHVKETAGGIDYRVGGSGGVEVANTQWDGTLRSYFRLDTDDIESIYADLRVRQDALIPALERYRGMRVLRQDHGNAWCHTCVQHRPAWSASARIWRRWPGSTASGLRWMGTHATPFPDPRC